MIIESELLGVRLLYSASVPKTLQGTDRAMVAQQLATTLLGGVLERGGEIVFGGHPTITPVVYHVVTRLQAPADHVHLHQLRRFDSTAPTEVREMGRFARIHWHEETGDIDEELAAMRDAMSRQANAAFFVGGQTARATLTRKPGLRDEWDRFRFVNSKAPAYVASLLDGYARESLVPDLHTGRIQSHDQLSDPARGAILDSTDPVDVDFIAGLVLADLNRYADRLDTS